MMKRKTVIIVVLILISCWAIYFYNYKQRQQASNELLILYGNVDIREVNLSFRVPGLVKRMFFEEGDVIKSGQVIAYIDREQYIDSFNEANAIVNANNAKLNKLLAGTRKEEVEQAKAHVQEQEAILVNAKLLLVRSEQGYRAGVISKQDYDEAKKQRDAASARLTLLKNALLEAVNGPRKEDIQAASMQLHAAKANAARFEKNIFYTVLNSPSDGVILTRIKEPGAYVAAGEPIYTLAINSPKWIQTYVGETNLGKIKPGMQAQITMDSYPNKVYIGKVGFISPTAEFTPKSVETQELRSSLVYRVRIIAQDPQNQLRQGMPVTVKVKI